MSRARRDGQTEFRLALELRAAMRLAAHDRARAQLHALTISRLIARLLAPRSTTWRVRARGGGTAPAGGHPRFTVNLHSRVEADPPCRVSILQRFGGPCCKVLSVLGLVVASIVGA
jgi:hypothetical protein